MADNGAPGYSPGVDLGTTFVAAAISRHPQPEMITLGDHAMVTPSVVYLREDGVVDTEVAVPVWLPGRHLEVRLTRSEFEDLIRAQVESTVGVLSRTLRSAQVEPAELTAVLLVGGSSRIPLVGRMVSEALGRPTVLDTHPKYADGHSAYVANRDAGTVAVLRIG